MKIAVATIEKNVDSEVSQRAGRAPYFLVFNEKGELLEEIKNPFTVGGGGAGIAVAKMLADKGVEAVIAGSIGGNMMTALEERGLKAYQREGKAKEVLKEVLEEIISQ